ncbi:hypothetical protein ACWDYJ_05430 [Streptomyces sp. NPDC003042]
MPRRPDHPPRREEPPPRTVVRPGETVEGQVRGLQTRAEQRGQSDYESVWTFRLERYDDAGRRVALVPVEMRGLTFEGALGEGDWVRAHGKMKSGTFRVARVDNHTTGAVVRAKGISKPALIVAGIFILCIVAFMAWGFFQIITMETGPPPDWPP